MKSTARGYARKIGFEEAAAFLDSIEAYWAHVPDVGDRDVGGRDLTSSLVCPRGGGVVVFH